MFNTSLYNGSLLGAGSGSRALITGAASRVVEVVGTLTTSMIKRSAIFAAPAVNATLRLTQNIRGAVSGIAEAVGTMVGHINTKTYFQQGNDYQSVVGTLRLSHKVSSPVSGYTYVSGSLVPRILKIVRMEKVTQVCGLNGTNSGIDVYVGPTPEERITYLAASDRVAYVTGPSGSAGV